MDIPAPACTEPGVYMLEAFVTDAGSLAVQMQGALRAVSSMYVRVSFDGRCVAGMFALVRPFHTIRQKLAAERAMPGFGAGFRHFE